MNRFGFFAAFGGISAILWLKLNHRKLGVSENEFWTALWLMVAGGVIGAKGVFVWLGWEHYASGKLSFWQDFWTGFVFFGGLLGALLVGIVFARVRGLNFWRGADYFAFALPMAHAIGRLGCYFTGCCPGADSHPVQLYEMAGLACISFACFVLLRRVEVGNWVRGSVFCFYGMSYGVLRFLLDPFRADGRLERYLGISHQQGISLAIVLSSVACLVYLNRRKKNHFFHSFRFQS